ncbi:tetratricopeptide repeat protein [Luteimonas viscosa]|uniref:Tetratricopeptide repeat protein n=1 Tax=Luteimonas viscosa TaxID=1132694 RepID=A0A5D4XP68_9GAMM|nr:tetratricopeptide repeat protein [Luteimonas viscosa]TYT26379.1 tetratricopeptide repeat protein [Luteimonas viscosa]
MKPKTRAFTHACTFVLFALFAGLSSAAAAQSLPGPAEFYFDEDDSVTVPIAIEGEDEATIERLVRLMERGGRNAGQSAAQLAHLAMASGRTDTGLALYARAMQLAEGSMRRRTLQWNQAWDLYRVGQLDAALSLWTQAHADRIVHPSWVPPTFALALWKLGRRDEAVAWYAAAVRTYPDRWSNPAALPGLLPDWSEADRATLAEVLEAWRQDPPAWP